VAEQRTPGWVHVGRFDVFVDESGRLATKPAPTEETVQAEGLATVIRDLRREPQKAVAALDQSVKSVKAATGMVEKLVELARDLANLSDPAIAAKRAEKFVARILDDYREGRFRDVVLLVGALLNIYLLAERWRALVALLQLDRLSAEELGDSAEALAAQHDLDVLAEACGLSPPAGESPDEAHDVAEPAGGPLCRRDRPGCERHGAACGADGRSARRQGGGSSRRHGRARRSCHGLRRRRRRLVRLGQGGCGGVAGGR
jgi:hypothetical protein